MKTKMLLYVLLFLLALSPAVLTAQSIDRRGIDVVLLIDVSGSMRGADRNRDAIEATKMFIDMLETRSSRIGIIAFNGEIVHSIEIARVESQEDKDRLRDIVDGFRYDGWTDIGMSLMEAVRMITADPIDANSPMIVLFTDGRIEIDEANTTRTVEQSYDDVATALATVGRRVPIYTVGLNYNNSVDAGFLAAIANATGGRSYIIERAEDLPQIFNEIFADHIRSTLLELADFITDGVNYTDVTINIESDFVAEANIIILSDHELLSAKLLNPAGEEVEFDQTEVAFSQARRYALIKVLYPERGEWTLQARGVLGDRIRVNLIYLFDVHVEMQVAQGPNAAEITGQVFVNGLPVEDPSFFDDVASHLVVMDEDHNELVLFPMTVENNRLVAEYVPQDDRRDVAVRIRATGPDFTAESVAVDIQFAPIAVEEPPAVQPPTPAPEPQERSMLGAAIAVVGALVVAIGAYAYFAKAKQQPLVFNGYVEVRALDNKKQYSSLETPPLSSYVGKTELKEFLSSGLKSKTKNRIKSLSPKLEGITLTPGTSQNQNIIFIENKSPCIITTEDGDALSGPKIVWRDGERLFIENSGDTGEGRLEITYRAEEI